MKTPFKVVMRDFCEWYKGCDRFGCAMDAAFKVADYMAESWSEYPLDYNAGLGGPGYIIGEDSDLAEYLDTLPRETVRHIAKTIDRYIDRLERAGLSY